MKTVLSLLYTILYKGQEISLGKGDGYLCKQNFLKIAEYQKAPGPDGLSAILQYANKYYNKYF